MNKRWDIPETSVTVRRLNKRSDEEDYQDCVAGIEFDGNGTLRLDLRNLRPIRVNDRENLIIELYLHDVLVALAEKMEGTIKDE